MTIFIQDKWKKVVIHEINKFDCNALAELHSLGVAPGGLGRPFLWANGVIFEHTPMVPTEEIMSAQIQGTIHWSSLLFAFMPEYKNLIMVGNISIQIANVDSNRLFHEMANWLKKTFREK